MFRRIKTLFVREENEECVAYARHLFRRGMLRQARAWYEIIISARRKRIHDTTSRMFRMRSLYSRLLKLQSKRAMEITKET